MCLLIQSNYEVGIASEFLRTKPLLAAQRITEKPPMPNVGAITRSPLALARSRGTTAAP